MFHDGSELTADDIVYSFQRLLAIGQAPSAPFLPILKPDSVTVQGRYSVRFQLDKPYGPFFAMIPMVFIVNPRVVKTHKKDGDWGAGWLASNEADSGAYRLIPSTYVPLEHVDMEKSEDHFLGWSDNPRPIRKIEWRPTQVTSTRVLALLNGSLDMTDSFLPVDQVERIEKSSNAHVVKNATMRLLLIRMNNTKPHSTTSMPGNASPTPSTIPVSSTKSSRVTPRATRHRYPTISGVIRKTPWAMNTIWQRQRSIYRKQ